MKDTFKNFFYTQMSKERNHTDSLKRKRRKKMRASFDKSTPIIKAGTQRTQQAFNFDPNKNDTQSGSSYVPRG